MNRKQLTRAGAASVAVLYLVLHALPHTAHAHAYVEPASAANGKSVKVAIGIPHGCDGAATDSVSVTIPEGFVDAQPQAKPGWQIAVTAAAYGKTYSMHGQDVTEGAVAITWSGGSLPDAQFDEFVVRGQFQGFEAETALPFVITQACGAASVSWDQLAGPGENAHGLEHPAPLVTVTPAAAGAHDMHDMSAMGDLGAAVATDSAAEIRVGDLVLTGMFTRATLPNAPVAGGFLTITNTGAKADRLVSASSPLAKQVDVHEMRMNGDVMEMRALPEGLDIPAGATVELTPGGYHLMLMAPSQPIVEGDTVPVTLTFEKAGSVEITLKAGGIGAKAPAEDHSSMAM